MRMTALDLLLLTSLSVCGAAPFNPIVNEDTEEYIVVKNNVEMHSHETNISEQLDAKREGKLHLTFNQNSGAISINNYQGTGGVWSGWSEFGLCSATCGAATKKRERTCSGGAQCPGSKEDTVDCTLSDCGTSQETTTAPTTSITTMAATTTQVCKADAVNSDACFCGGAPCTAGQRCSTDGTCQTVCKADAVNSDDCFCKSPSGGALCTAGKRCSTSGDCQIVCKADAVNSDACFCSGGATCTAGERCITSGACQIGICPKKTDYNGIISENKWTEKDLNEMSDNQKRNVIINKVVEMTAIETSVLQGKPNAKELTAIANMASILIGYKIETISDVKKMTHDNLRNTLITELKGGQDLKDHQLVEKFCEKY